MSSVDGSRLTSVDVQQSRIEVLVSGWTAVRAGLVRRASQSWHGLVVMGMVVAILQVRARRRLH